MTNKALTRQEAAQLLGVSMTATPLQIRKAFRRLAKSVHPDVNPSAEAKEQFIRLQDAQRILLEPRSYDKFAPPKQNYDGWMHRSQHVARDFTQRYVDPRDVKVAAAIEPFFLGVLRLMAVGIICANVLLFHATFVKRMPWILLNILSLTLLVLARKQSVRSFIKAASVLLLNRIFLIIATFLVNLSLFWTIGMRTFLPIPIQLFFLLGLPFGFLFFHYLKDKLEGLGAIQFFRVIAIGLLFNLSIVLNYITAKPYNKGLWNWTHRAFIISDSQISKSENEIMEKRLRTKIEPYSERRKYDMPIVLKKGLFANCMEY